MKIVIEDKVPFLDGVFEPYAEVSRIPSSAITAGSLRDADALIARTRPRLDASTLHGTGVKVIATATIGTDHIDLDYCRSHGIKVYNAPGCNAPAVAQWVLASILSLPGLEAGATIGIVGAGNVGTIVARWAADMGFSVLLNDPPREKLEEPSGFVPLERIAREADIITFHTPLTRDTEFPTYHLADGRFFNSLHRKPVIVNAARGEVVETPSLVAALHDGKVSHALIDCWEGEPVIDRELLALADVATPHIAGYSIEGKRRASAAAAQAVAVALGLTDVAMPWSPPLPEGVMTRQRILQSYNPTGDTSLLKSQPDKFEYLRNNYNLRREP